MYRELIFYPTIITRPNKRKGHKLTYNLKKQ